MAPACMGKYVCCTVHIVYSSILFQFASRNAEVSIRCWSDSKTKLPTPSASSRTAMRAARRRCLQPPFTPLEQFKKLFICYTDL